jgi:hypothetical protein
MLETINPPKNNKIGLFQPSDIINVATNVENVSQSRI